MGEVQVERNDGDVVMGNNIRRLRLLSRMTQTELAHMLSMYLTHPTSHFQVSFHETGVRRVSGMYLHAYSRVFKVPARFLYQRTADENEFQQAVNDWYQQNGLRPIPLQPESSAAD